jgi:hypothetical protein
MDSPKILLAGGQNTWIRHVCPRLATEEVWSWAKAHMPYNTFLTSSSRAFTTAAAEARSARVLTHRTERPRMLAARNFSSDCCRSCVALRANPVREERVIERMAACHVAVLSCCGLAAAASPFSSVQAAYGRVGSLENFPCAANGEQEISETLLL